MQFGRIVERGKIRVPSRFRWHSSLHTRTPAFYQCLNFLERRHRCVSRCGHSERPMRGAVLDRFLRIIELYESVNQSACKTIATTYAIQDLHVLTIGRFEKFPASPANGAPVIPGCGTH